ncbi:conserved hypothetical protein [Ricinus communis]|uniref:Uncharacterized protein n=1 Tax=Ricinus communis TaxID=3988 RepID=B9RMW9_RICCO|nr:conserved hypothetical protein [Ricinus communis]
MVLILVYTVQIAIIKVPLEIILDYVLQQLGLSVTRYDMQEGPDDVFTCNMYLSHYDSAGNKFVSSKVGISSDCAEDA